jgi:hypothetical protein
MKKAILIYLVFLLPGCTNNRKLANDLPVARVYDNYLYKSQIKGIVPYGLSTEDSLLVIKDHIDKWVRKQLLLYQAEQNLSEEEKNVEKQIEDYRTSLLVFKYEESYINQKLDTVITDKEIEEYYDSYSPNFILNNNLFKGIYVQVPRTAPEIYKIRRWYRSDDPEHLKDLESYCYNYATKYEYYEEKWIYFDEILSNMPDLYLRPENLLKYRKNFEIRDSTHYHFLKISDYRLARAVAPMEFIKEDIKSILLNKRKIQLIQELEANVYNDALNRDNFNIY